MANHGSLGDMIVKNGIHVLETMARAYLRKDEYVDTGANIAAGGLRGGGIRGQDCPEWIFAEDQTGDFKLLGTRKYSELEGEKELENVSEIVFGQSGEIRDYKTGEPGKHPMQAYPDNDAEMLGLLHGMTGGILPGNRGEPDKYHDRSELRFIAAETAFEYYMKKGRDPRKRKSLGKDVLGREIYTVQIPRTENHFHFLDPREYDVGLIGEYFKIGSWYAALEPFFTYPKKVLESLGMRIDPAGEIQIKTAKDFSGSSVGNLAYVAYPLLVAAVLGKKHGLEGWHFQDKSQATH